MKNIYYFIILLALAVSCSKSVVSEGVYSEAVGGMISLSSEFGLENEPEVKVVADGHMLRYVVEAWTVGTNPRCVFHEEFSGNGSGVEVAISLVPGVYDLLFWADYGEGAYSVSDLRNVRREFTNSNIVSYDAFAAVSSNVEWNSACLVKVKLVRPVSKLSVFNKQNFVDAKQVNITYSNLPTLYDVLTGVASVGIGNGLVSVPYPMTSSGGAMAAQDFLFVPAMSSARVGMQISVGSVEKSLNNVPLKPNYEVNVTADFKEKK